MHVNGVYAPGKGGREEVKESNMEEGERGRRGEGRGRRWEERRGKERENKEREGDSLVPSPNFHVTSPESGSGQ